MTVSPPCWRYCGVLGPPHVFGRGVCLWAWEVSFHWKPHFPSSYYNLSLMSVRPPSPRPFMDRWAPNLVGRSGAAVDRTLRYWFPWQPNCFNANQKTLSLLTYWPEGTDFLSVLSTGPYQFACRKWAKSTRWFPRYAPSNCLATKFRMRLWRLIVTVMASSHARVTSSRAWRHARRHHHIPWIGIEVLGTPVFEFFKSDNY